VGGACRNQGHPLVAQNPPMSREEEEEHRLLYNQRSRPLVVRRENASLTDEA